MFLKKCGRFILVLLTLSLAVAAFGCAGPQISPAPTPNPTTSTDAGNLQVHVVDPSNNSLAGAKVVAQNQPAGQLKVTGITYRDGLATFNGILAGQYDFTISQFNSQPRNIRVNVVAGQTTNIKITLELAPNATVSLSPSPG